jgi:phage host-nuclease inhibitor protein Gam
MARLIAIGILAVPILVGLGVELSKEPQKKLQNAINDRYAAIEEQYAGN